MDRFGDEVNTFLLHMSANILLHFIYDDDIEIPVYETINGKKTKVGTTKSLQFKELLGIGLSYKF